LATWGRIPKRSKGPFWVQHNITYSYVYRGEIISYSGSDSDYYFGADGWVQNTPGIQGGGSTYATADWYTYDTFSNSVFCAGNITYIYYEPNEVVGNDYEQIASGTDSYDSGGCSILLHQYTIVN
jgi:hypothetical protein